VFVAVLVGLSTRVSAEIRISEILYDPIQGGDFEFLEIHNTGDSEVSIEGWAFTRGVRFVFPEGTMIGAGAYLVVAEDPAALAGAYEHLDEADLFGPYEGNLDNSGENLTLSDDQGNVAETLRFDDDSPWEFLADIFGASLERLCYEAGANLPENWRAGHTPRSEKEFAGSPGQANAASACPPVFPDRAAVKISEVMYHPVLEESFVERHEFIEIHNPSDAPISIAGWRLAGGIDFEFPDGATIDAGAYRVIAKHPAALAEIDDYELELASLFGPYERELDNGGEKVALLDADGQGIESLTYDDDFPWPIGADAFGAGEVWLRRDLIPLTQHRYKGISLERVSFDVPSGLVANWAPSPVDGATPGRANASARDELLPIASGLIHAPLVTDPEDKLIRDDDEVRIQVAFSPTKPKGGVSLEFFIENVDRTDEEISKVDMHDDGVTGGDLIPDDGIYTVTMPARDDNTIVRYRVLAKLEDAKEAEEVRISPRPSDPKDWHAYFVSPVVNTDTPIYQVFIGRIPWGRMWSNIQGGRVSGCNFHPTWNRREFAVFVYEGEVFDCRVRYQGSRWNRRNGRTINRWTHSRPASGPLMALSWRISLPRYAGVNGRDELTLNKLTQSCPGFNAVVGFRMFGELGLPSPQTQFVRLHINGGYYHYMIEYERPDENMIRRYNRERREHNPDGAREPIGNLYKSVGCNCDEGPYGWGDARILRTACGHSDLARYAATYPRKTNEWGGHEEFKNLIEELHAAWQNGRGSVVNQRAYFEKHFDIDLLLDYVAFMNYQVPFDDMFQNHFWYQRASDGLWTLAPWDLDRNFGEWQGANSSIWMGMRGDRSNRSGWSHLLKDSFLRAFPEEYQDRLFLLNNTILHPDNFEPLVDEAFAMANPAEAAQAPAGVACSIQGRVGSFKAFIRSRHTVINNTIAAVRIDAGDDQTVFAGSTVTFDASGSSPEPSEDAPYTWSNGMVGATPTAVFAEPGIYEITLTITVRDLPFTDTVKITVLPIPEEAFAERDGVVVFEAEDFWQNERYESERAFWEERSDVEGFAGRGYMEAVEIERARWLSRYVGLAPELRYPILFERAGDYRVWIHAFARTSSNDSVHVTLDGVARGSTDAQEFVANEEAYQWSGIERSDDPQLLTVREPGVHYVSIWIRESGLIVDKVVMTLDHDFVPEGHGPDETGKVSLGKTKFIRSDADRDDRITITDAVAVLGHLFAGVAQVECEDHGDFDDSGRLNIADAIGILNFLFQRGVVPAQPFPEAGFDTTPDQHECGDQ